jgi:RimJ/RimL family protein N-acetyltransferase
MLHGRFVTLREIRRSDLQVMHREFHSDVVTASLSNVDPWRPMSLARLEAEFDRTLTEPESPQHVRFAVQERGDEVGELIGSCGLWQVDLHNRIGHVGIQLVSSVRGRGLGTDVVRVLCHYAFVVRGLHRLSLETLASNQAMRTAASKAGFVEEGRIREAAYLLGERVDEITFGLLRSEWRPAGEDIPTEEWQSVRRRLGL